MIRMSEFVKSKSIKERKLALINQINQINSQLHNIAQLDNRDSVQRPVDVIEITESLQSSKG